MIVNYLNQLLLIVKRLLICYLLYFICRLFFYVGNASLFPSVNFTYFMQDAIYGLRFDTFSIFACNSLFILLSALPFNFFNSKFYQGFIKWLFVISNSVFIMANCVDVAYFKFIKKRSSADLFQQIGGQTDLGKLLPQYLKDFWWVVLIYILLVWLLIYLYKRIKPITILRYVYPGLKPALVIFLVFSVLTGLVILGIRGGLQRIPIDIVNAGSVTSPEEVPIVLNTPFTLIKSTGQKAVTNYTFMMRLI